MKKVILPFCLLLSSIGFSQDHFGGVNTSKRVGLLNVGVNPSELANLSSTFEIQGSALSLNFSNNKIGFSDISAGKNLESIIFNGNETVNANFNAQLALVGVGFKAFGWGFAITTNSFIQVGGAGIDPNFGKNIVVSNDDLNVNIRIGSDINQRFNAVGWGEVGFSAARKVFEEGNHLINAGMTVKMLFPRAYTNVGLNRLSGDIRNYGASTDLYLTNVNNATINFAYSGSLANDFTDASNYSKALFGGFNGFSTDFGTNYVWKKSGNGYKLKVGASVRNIGSLTFKGNNNQSTNYRLTIPVGSSAQQGLKYDLFSNVKNLDDLETVLSNQNGVNGIVFTKINQETNFKVKLPTVFNFYADYNVTTMFNLTVFLQQKVTDNSDNEQILSENIFSITPRVNVGPFETFIPISFNEFAGTTAGAGIRLGGFFVGSNSILTAITNNSKQADLYLGFRVGFL